MRKDYKASYYFFLRFKSKLQIRTCRYFPRSRGSVQVLSSLQVWTASDRKGACPLFDLITISPVTHICSLHYLLPKRFTGISFKSESRDYAYLRHYSSSQRHQSRFTILSLVLHADRIPTYYLYRIVSVMLLVTTLKLCTSLVPLVDYNTKASVICQIVNYA